MNRVSGASAPIIQRMPSTPSTVTDDSIEVTVGRREVMVPRGMTLGIRGWATGDPSPSYGWLKDGSPVSDGGKFGIDPSGMLQVRNVGPGEAGRYTLVATNSAGEDRESIDVVLPGKN